MCSSGYLQRLITDIFSDLDPNEFFAYVDNLYFVSNDIQDLAHILKQVLEKVERHSLLFHIQKSTSATDTHNCLGYLSPNINTAGLRENSCPSKHSTTYHHPPVKVVFRRDLIFPQAICFPLKKNNTFVSFTSK